MSLAVRAIALAEQQGRIQDTALANELAGKFYLQQGQPHPCRNPSDRGPCWFPGLGRSCRRPENGVRV